MGRRGLKPVSGGVQFVSNQIGSLVTLGPSQSVENVEKLHSQDFGRIQLADSLEKLHSQDVGRVQLLAENQTMKLKGAEARAQIQRLNSIWDKNKRLLDDSQRLMLELQSLPAPSTAEETTAVTARTILKEILPDPLPVVVDAWDQRPSFLKFGDNVGTGDSTIGESLANVATSAPFLYIGLNTPRNNVYNRIYARSMLGVGVASSMYHTSRGTTRPFFRWCDYAMIGASSMCMSKALNPDLSNRWLLLSASLLPFQPMLVTAVHTAAMEMKFAKRSLAEPERYQKAHRMHAASTLLGGVCFLAEEVYPDVPFIHAAWHVAAALAVHTSSALLK